MHIDFPNTLQKVVSGLFSSLASSSPENSPWDPMNRRLGDRCLVTDKRFTKLYKSVNKCVEPTDGNGADRTEI
jgi:hypothetical protein